MPLILGAFIYVIYRSETLYFFTWINKVGLTDTVENLRSNRYLQEIKFPIWVKFSLPDALWLFSFNYILLIFWKFDLNRDSAIWLFLSSSIGILSEIGQLIELLPGTFDPFDLGLLLIATLIPFLFMKNSNFKFN